MISELPVEKLRIECDPKQLPCQNTESIQPLEEIIGQDRAIKALKFGLDIKEDGFNIYAAGLPGSGRMTAVKDFLEDMVKDKPTPSDWCYINNFSNPFIPNVLELPPGQGKVFQKDIKNFIEEARNILPKAFESEEYTTKKEAVVRVIDKERRELLAQLNERAREEGFVLQSTKIGILIVPVVDGKPLSDKDFLALAPQIREKIQRKRDDLGKQLRSAFRQLKDFEKKGNEEIQKLNREVTLYSIGYLVDVLTEKYKTFSEVKNYLEEVRNDILENVTLFVTGPKAPEQLSSLIPFLKEAHYRKYEVNVVVDNSTMKNAPVIMELNPTHHNLFGRIEKEARLGVLTTDFTMIQGGSLHRANGGYLVLPVEELLRNMFSYDALKRSLMNKCIIIEEAGERLGGITSKGLRPESIPLDVKLILIGKPLLYQQLYLLDADFKELFKVKADFDTTMDRTDNNISKYVGFICTLCQKEKLKHLQDSGIAKVVEYSSRIAHDQQKLSTRFGEIADIIRESNFYASQENSKYITADHIKKTLEEKVYRSNLIQEKIKESIQRNILFIDTEGEAVGQVNGLSVISLGDFSFGRPSRVTASIGLGREGLIDIEREAKLGGKIHTKGVMILRGYLAERYARDKPLSLSARLVFEQSYGMIDGDSASSTELYALLSTLSDLPIKQSIAVTGSVNQKGEVQAIGGVNEKIEGYFEICKTKGLTGEQGVLIPESNIQNLMLKEEVVEAVQAGKFHVYPVRTIDQGIEILTGIKAGKKDLENTFEEGSINDKVNKRLQLMAEKLKEYPGYLPERENRKE